MTKIQLLKICRRRIVTSPPLIPLPHLLSPHASPSPPSSPSPPLFSFLSLNRPSRMSSPLFSPPLPSSFSPPSPHLPSRISPLSPPLSSRTSPLLPSLTSSSLLHPIFFLFLCSLFYRLLSLHVITCHGMSCHVFSSPPLHFISALILLFFLYLSFIPSHPCLSPYPPATPAIAPPNTQQTQTTWCHFQRVGTTRSPPLYRH